jgi:hypothetical protein
MADDNFLEPADDTPVPIATPEEQMPGLAGHITGLFKQSEHGRLSHEQKWLQSFKNFRGIYDSSTQYRDSEKSRVFIKITKTKVLAAYGQLVDILFSNKKFPIVVESTPVPEGIAEFAHMETPLDQVIDPYGFQGDGRNIPAGASDPDELGEKYKDLPLKKGPSKMGEPQVSPAQESALKLEKVIHDQLLDTNATTVFRNAIFEASMLGTGVIKGPFNHHKRVHKWTGGEEGRQYDPYEKTVPKLEYVSIWDFHPDPAATNMNDCEYVIQRHRMTRQQLRGLINKPYFDAEMIQECISKGPNYEDKYYEDTIRDDETQPNTSENRFEVLEYWGVLDAHFAREVGLEVSDELSDLDQVQINAWICGDCILRCVLNPFTPARIPYHAFPYEVNPYQLWGIGVAENMEDAQLLMNGHVRMAIDNLALAGNLVFDVDEASLVPGQNMDIFPGKIFRRQSGVTGTAINGLKFPNTAGENLQMYQISRQLADEETGLPSIMHGQTGVSGTGRTAAGLSMLLGGASLSIKTVIKNIDDYLLKPIGESYFQWNMQFNDKAPEIIGDLEIKPSGSTGVMQKEIRSQRLTALLQTVANPMLAPFIKLPNLMRELAISQDIDPDKMVNNINEAQIYAKMLQGLQDAQQQASQAGSPPNKQSPNMAGAGGVPNRTEGASGGGNDGSPIGVGTTPTAGEAGFTGNTPQTET